MQETKKTEKLIPEWVRPLILDYLSFQIIDSTCLKGERNEVEGGISATTWIGWINTN